MRSIHGSPLNIYANDNGQLQVSFDGSPTGEFSPPSLAAGPGRAERRGREASPSPRPQFTVFGFLGAPFTQPAAPTVTGDGSAANPWTLTTNYRADTPTANQRRGRSTSPSPTSTGRRTSSVQYAVVNLSDGATLNVRAVRGGGTSSSPATTSASGFLDPGPPRAAGQRSTQAAGGSVRLVEQTPAGRTTRRAGRPTCSPSSPTPAWPPRASTTRSSRPSSTTAPARSGTSRP